MTQGDFVSRATQLISAGQFHEAVKVCRLGLLGRPATVDGRLVLGRALLALGRHDEVIAEMRVALELDESCVGAHVLRGEALLGKRDPLGAVAALKHAQSLAPADPAIGALVRKAEAQLASPRRVAPVNPDFSDESSNVPTTAFDPIEGEMPTRRRSPQDMEALVRAAEQHQASLKEHTQAISLDELEEVRPTQGSPRPPHTAPVREGGVVLPSLPGLPSQLPTQAHVPAANAPTVTVPQPHGSPPLVYAVGQSHAQGASRVTLARRRERLYMLGWVAVAVMVIGAGIVAGFWIREKRLRKQIADVAEKARIASKDDTWQGHQAARDLQLGVVKVRSSDLIRDRIAVQAALLAYEFGEDAQGAALKARAAGSSQLGAVANGYIALSRGDGAQARKLASTIIKTPGLEAVGYYLDGRGALLLTDAQTALASLRTAVERDPRPLYQVALAQAMGANWALGDADKMFLSAQRSGMVPSAVVARALFVLHADTSKISSDLISQVETVVALGGKPLGDPRAAPPLWAALALAARAEIAIERNDLTVAEPLMTKLASVAFDDWRLAERLIVLQLKRGQLAAAKAAADKALEIWPQLISLRAAQAMIALRQGDVALAATHAQALAGLRTPEMATVRGRVAMAQGNLTDATKEFDAALKIAPGYLDAMVARGWIDVSVGDGRAVIARLGRIAPDAPGELATLFAAGLRLTGEYDQATGILRRVVGLPPGDFTPVAYLELGRIYRERGELAAARRALADAAQLGLRTAKLEGAQLATEDRDLDAGRAILEELAATEKRSPIEATLLIELVRARTLAGELVGAQTLLASAEGRSDVPQWRLLRERGRLALKKGDVAAAAAALAHAMEDKQADIETLLLVANVVESDANQTALATALRSTANARLTGRGELEIINGKLALSGGHLPQAASAFARAKDQLLRTKASPRRLAIAHLGLAAVAFLQRRDDSARVDVEAALELDPASVEAYLFAADLAPLPQRRLELLQRAVQLSPNHSAAWLLLAKTAGQLGNKPLLGMAVNKLSELVPNSPDLPLLRAYLK